MSTIIGFVNRDPTMLAMLCSCCRGSRLDSLGRYQILVLYTGTQCSCHQVGGCVCSVLCERVVYCYVCFVFVVCSSSESVCMLYNA